MIRSSRIRIVVFMQCVFYCMGSLSFDVSFAQPGNEQGRVLPLSLAPTPGVTVRKMVNKTVRWDGEDYPAAEGIRILMRVIMNPVTDPNRRTEGLEHLGRLGPWLHNTDRIPELIALYDTLTAPEEKGRLVACLAVSDDARAFPIFTRFLSEATDDVARFVGAYALAQWNARRGVRELITLLESRELEPEGQSFANEVLKALQGLNVRKGWGLPEQEILRRVMSQSDLNQDQKTALHIVEIKKWFAENEHRFPDWKPGDPLPEAPGEVAIPKDRE